MSMRNADRHLRGAVVVLILCLAMAMMGISAAQARPNERHVGGQCIDSTDAVGRVVTLCAGINIADDDATEANGYAAADPLDPAFRYEILGVTLYNNNETSAVSDGAVGSGSGPIGDITPPARRSPCADQLYSVAQLRWRSGEGDPWTYDTVQSAVYSCP